MKKNQLTLIHGVLSLSLFLFSINAFAQEEKYMNTKMNHVLADTSFMHAVEVTLHPGEFSDLRTRPAYFFYALTDGRLKVYHQGAKDEIMDLKHGFSELSGPEGKHVIENVGTKTVKFLVVELKDYPYSAQK
jgi:mannose-6-phosphate isomerase-like protein (cupin superfamily)